MSPMFDNKDILTTSKEERSFNLFWLGFILYVLCYLFFTTSHSLIILLQVIQFGSLVLMISTAPGFFQFKIGSSYLKFIFTLYFIWQMVTVLRGNISFNVTDIKSVIVNPSELLLYFSPLLLFFPRNLLFYKKLFTVIIILGIFYIFYSIIFVRILLNPDDASEKSKAFVENLSSLSFSCGFILLTLFYHSKKRQILAAGIIFLSLFFLVIRGRRGSIFMFCEILTFSYIIYIIQSRKKVMIIYLTAVIVLIGTLYISEVYKPLQNRFYGFLLSRGEEDTRTGVELYFYDDMKTKDWIIGRGIEGKYFCPDIEENQLTNYRDAIETGYLNTILKGGLISLILYLLIAIPGIIKGIFYSKNVLSKSAGIWILMNIINSYPAIVNGFDLQYLLVWISIGICYSNKIRSMPEMAVQKIFKSNFHI